MNKKVLLALGSIIGASANAENVDLYHVNYNDDASNSTLELKKEGLKRSKEYTLKVNFADLDNSFACFHASHSSHSSHASHSSHSSHSSSSFV